MEPIIEIKNLGKRYNINHQRGGYVALRDVLANVAKSPLRFLKQKAKSVAGVGGKEEFWALRNLDLTINKGDIVGVIGANGAGKSTLLKILTGITPPTEGEIRMHGRVASLLEVGTGFHPELTGRENIFLNGAILGMSRKEITRKFDEIVAFAGVEKFLDTPVKYYSSGMYVRLAFSVAAHMEPDILLVDEVLAVGDAEFQKKCLGKMEEVTKQAGRTIIFVSHSMAAIQTLCKKTVFLKNGQLAAFGNTDDVIREYLGGQEGSSAILTYTKTKQKDAFIREIRFLNKKQEPAWRLPINETFALEIDFEVLRPIKQSVIYLWFYSQGEILLSASNADQDGRLQNFEPGTYTTTVKIPAFLFNHGNYFMDVRIQQPFVEDFDYRLNIPFEIIDAENPRTEIFRGKNLGKIATQLPFQIHKHS
jgi:lipopolysaccharide transport system ATP-binding protein